MGRRFLIYLTQPEILSYVSIKGFLADSKPRSLIYNKLSLPTTTDLSSLYRSKTVTSLALFSQFFILYQEITD